MLAALPLGMLTACSSSRPAAPLPPSAALVAIKNVAFRPRTVTVRAGEAVAWMFDDGPIAHDVSGGEWSSPVRTSGYYTHTFTAAGSYAYRCTIHSGMDGLVVVTP